MLGDLLLLDSCRELSAIREVGDGNIVEDDVEVVGPMDKGVMDKGGDLGPLGEELFRVKLGDAGLEYLIANGPCHHTRCRGT